MPNIAHPRLHSKSMVNVRPVVTQLPISMWILLLALGVELVGLTLRMTVGAEVIIMVGFLWKE